MNLNLIDNYIYTRQLDLDIEKIKKSSLRLRDLIKNNIIDDGTGFDGKISKGNVPPEAKLFSQYNSNKLSFRFGNSLILLRLQFR